MKIRYCIAMLVLLLPFAALMAQEAEKKKEDTGKKENQTEEAALPGEVVVRGETFNVNKSAFTVNTIDSKDIEKKKITKSADIVLEAPGVEVRHFNRGGVPDGFSMRGFATGFHSGDIAAYLDGVGLNEWYGQGGGGTSDPNIIVPIEIDRVDVYKGPSSARFGNFSRGGTVSFTSKRKGEYINSLMKYGSDETVDLQAGLGTKISDTMWNNTAVQLYRTDGYTASSDQVYGTASTSFTWAPMKDLEITASGRAYTNVWNNAGAMSEANFKGNDPYGYTNGNDDEGCKEIYLGQVRARYALSESLSVDLLGFAYKTDMFYYATFNVNTMQQTLYDWDVLKSGTTGTVRYMDRLLTVDVGVDFIRNESGYRNYNTLQHQIQGAALTDCEATMFNLAFFTEGEVKIHRLFRPTVGVRYDLFKVDYTNNVTGTDGSIAYTDYDHVSPKVGFVSTLIDELLDIRVGVSNGFILPSDTTVLYEKNKDITEIWQYEVGAVVTRGWFVIDVAGFILDTKNELIKDTATNEWTNAGETRRFGFESMVKAVPVKWFEVFGKFSWIDSEILENPNAALEGKELKSIPKKSASAGFYAYLPAGFTLKAAWSYTGRYYLDDLNNEEYSGYNLVDVGVSYRFLYNGRESELAFEVKNVLDEEYASSVGYNSSYGKTYYIGPPRTYWVSYAMKW